MGDHNVQTNIFLPPQWEAQRPGQLPAAVAHFTGRSDELALLTRLLRERAAAGGTVVISAIGGTAGVGKTAVAVHWAHQVAGEFPDGQLYVNLRGFEPAGSVMEPAEAVRQFLDALGVPAERIPVDLDAQAALYRSQLARRRVLVVLDNARDTVQVRPLLPGAPGCLVVVTSRNHLSGLVAADGAHPITLDLLTPAEARKLLDHRLGLERVAAEPEAVAEIIAECARLPLALAIVAARAATHPHLSLQTLAVELRDAGARLDKLTTDDPYTDVRAVFSWSYQALSEGGARLFRLLGLHPGPDISTAAAASLAAVGLRQVRAQLVELTQANLIVEPVPGRYAFHDLLRAYATELNQVHEDEHERREALCRVLEYYLRTAYQATLLVEPRRGTQITPLSPRAGVLTHPLADPGQALSWFTAEYQAMLAAVEKAATAGLNTHTWQLAWALTTFQGRQGHWQQRAATARTALHAVQRLDDPAALAIAHRSAGYAYAELGRFDEAQHEFSQALETFRLLGDTISEAHTTRGIAWLCERQGRYRDALRHSERVGELFASAGERVMHARAQNASGYYRTLLGDHAQALALCSTALATLQECEDGYGEAVTQDSLGLIYHHLGQQDEAAACYRAAIELYQRFGDQYEQAATLTRLGDVHFTLDQPEAARDAWQQALTILDQLSHPDAEKARTKLAALDTASGRGSG